MTDLDITFEKISNFDGKSIVVTGGSSGIGLSIARLAKEKGARVLISDLAPPKDSSSEFEFHPADVTKWSDLVALMEAAKEKFGTIDMVCANAGIAKVPEDTFADSFDSSGKLLEPNYKIIQVNLIGVCNTVKLAIHYMKQQSNGGSIVITASMSGYSSMGLPIYAASKHGVIGMMRGLRSWISPFNIRLNCVSPGITTTAINPNGAIDTLASVGVSSQSSDYPALAALYLHQTSNMNGTSVFCANKKFRELEAGIAAASEIIYGQDNGRSYTADERQLQRVRDHTIKTII